MEVALRGWEYLRTSEELDRDGSLKGNETTKRTRASASVAWRTVKGAWRRVMRGRRKMVVRLVRRPVASVSRRFARIRMNTNGARLYNKQRDYAAVTDNKRVAKYDMLSYSKNFDDGEWQQEDAEYYRIRSFAYRFGHTRPSDFHFLD